ncbi:hypothetical protein [Flavicella sediminum]|uniref:hypothetical protein n=1 Tax=Flavicella sediminum TaxID=2585141 RepID=UPI00111C9803|nr:hypothetical protein [Flavicella sediminum]
MKLNFIKNSIGLFLLSMLLCAVDCSDLPEHTYTLKNDSEKTIRIKSFKSDILDNEINLEKGEIYIRKVKNQTVNFSNIFSSTLLQSIDSLVVIYDETKMNSFVSSNEDIRNPIGHFNRDNDIITFIFTEEDYNNAINCEGNCE